MPRHIGIVACSAEGAALCYRTICEEGAQFLGVHGHPEVSMHTHSFADYVACADFLICPDNTIHAALPRIAGRLPLPWLHIAESVAACAAARQFRRLGLTGTRWLVESEVYGPEYVRPNAGDREKIHGIIMDELVRGVFKPEAVVSLQKVIGRMKDAGCDAVVLGCTELPLILNDANSPLPTLDSTRLLARAALRQAVG